MSEHGVITIDGNNAAVENEFQTQLVIMFQHNEDTAGQGDNPTREDETTAHHIVSILICAFSVSRGLQGRSPSG